MDRLIEFAKWMKINKNLSDSSVYKYRLAVKTISKDMLGEGVIYKDLATMSLLELDLAMVNILENKAFRDKNLKGHQMYSSSLKQFRYYMLLQENIPDEKAEEALLGNVSPTERMVLMKAKIGQGAYRDGLMQKYGGKCVITGISQPKLLIASHIKPWIVSTNQERIDVNNGLLLSANMDKLFDSGLMTFENDGRMRISPYLGKENSKLLGVANNMVVDFLPTKELLEYMEYHRDVLFVK